MSHTFSEHLRNRYSIIIPSSTFVDLLGLVELFFGFRHVPCHKEINGRDLRHERVNCSSFVRRFRIQSSKPCKILPKNIAFDYKFSEFHLQVIHDSKDIVKNAVHLITRTRHGVTTFIKLNFSRTE